MLLGLIYIEGGEVGWLILWKGNIFPKGVSHFCFCFFLGGGGGGGGMGGCQISDLQRLASQ